MVYKLNEFVVKKTSLGYEILRHDKNACAYTSVMDMKNMWFNVEPFKSFIHAVRFLKKNVNDLI